MSGIEYFPPGKVAAAFHMNNSLVRGLMGCMSSGKSSICCNEIMTRAVQQEPYKGVRRSRWAVIRNRFEDLENSTVVRWTQWFPYPLSESVEGLPISCKISIANVGDSTSVESEILFLAMDRLADIEFLESVELTGAWMSKVSEMPKRIFDMVRPRIGLFPDVLEGGASWFGIIMDTDPPNADHWYYKLAEGVTPSGFNFFRQPGGLLFDECSGRYIPNPEAENIQNLEGGHQYYLDLINGKDAEWINTRCCGNYGVTVKTSFSP